MTLNEELAHSVVDYDAAKAAHLQGFSEETAMPGTLLSQHCPRQYDEIRAERLKNDPKALVIANVRTVLGTYSRACRGDRFISD